jgi:hypothetical protein
MSGIAALLALAACNRSPDATLTVQYYRAHAAERESMVRACVDDPGQLRNSPSCVNAREAARLENIGSLRGLPPMGLPGMAPDKAPESARKE